MTKRHTSPEGFDRFLASGVPVVLPIRGVPESFVFIEPLKPELGLRVEVQAGTPTPETGLRNINARTARRGDKLFLEVVVTAPTLFRDAYPVLCSMADRVQVDGLSPVAALRATLDKMSALLVAPDSMSREREIGLFGELVVLGGLLAAVGPDAAVAAWRGGLAEEHDFGLPTSDIEVKTTSSERRAHWIESLTQLVPTGDRPLWVVSHQITPAGAGDGRTLPEAVDALRETLGHGDPRTRFEQSLIGSGWRDEDRERLTTRWTRRTESRAFRVTDDFPRLTPEGLRTGGVPLDRIPDVRYRIDLDGFTGPGEPDPEIEKIIAFEGWTR
ncbi:PD-(D/E)XK motif protein [Actinokineospora soli]|uniref:PD-(D/E)XK motif protein n=1 Tax=Actinokineospora soli TaxID=1048753 RepID=A0ABW2TGX6_9PSEU